MNASRRAADDPIREAAAVALAGLLIVIPTDTVYGVGTRPDDAAATARLFEAKGRPRELELPVLCPDADRAGDLAIFDERAERLARAYWPGPLTIVLPRSTRSRGWDLGGDPSTIGVRVPRHPLALAVLGIAGTLAVTSANRSGEETPQTCDGLRSVFAEDVELYLCDEGPVSGVASTIVDLAHGAVRVIRPGTLDVEGVLAVSG